jgi:hypothetical protein
MSDATIASAFLLAFNRFVDAGRGQDAQIALFEVLTWLDLLAERPTANVKGLPHVPCCSTKGLPATAHAALVVLSFGGNSGADPF